MSKGQKIMVYILQNAITNELTSTLEDFSEYNIGQLIILPDGEFYLINKTEVIL